MDFLKLLSESLKGINVNLLNILCINNKKRVQLHFVVRGILNSLERRRKRVLVKLFLTNFNNYFLTKYLPHQSKRII